MHLISCTEYSTVHTRSELQGSRRGGVRTAVYLMQVVWIIADAYI